MRINHSIVQSTKELYMISKILLLASYLFNEAALDLRPIDHHIVVRGFPLDELLPSYYRLVFRSLGESMNE